MLNVIQCPVCGVIYSINFMLDSHRGFKNWVGDDIDKSLRSKYRNKVTQLLDLQEKYNRR